MATQTEAAVQDRHLLPASLVCDVVKLSCTYKNICREFNGNRRGCCDPTVHRHYSVGLDKPESENITCMNELLEEQQGQRNPSVHFQFCFPVPPPSSILSQPVISLMYDMWKEPFHSK